MKNGNALRLKWLLWPLAGSALLITVQAWNGGVESQQSVSTGPLNNTLDARLSPTVHAPVPATLGTMWYVPAEEAPQSGPLANLARGVQILEDGGSATEALPLVTNPSLAKTRLADYAKYYAGIAFTRLDRLDEADATFAAL